MIDSAIVQHYAAQPQCPTSITKKLHVVVRKSGSTLTDSQTILQGPRTTKHRR